LDGRLRARGRQRIVTPGDQSKQPMNVIIMGCGRTGAILARSLSNSGHSVTVIDLDRRNAASLPADKMASGDIRVIEGDGSTAEVLEEARIDQADLFIALTGKSSLNGLAALKAKQVYRVMTAVAAVKSTDLGSVYEGLGVACVHPARLVADQVIAAVPQILLQTDIQSAVAPATAERQGG